MSHTNSQQIDSIKPTAKKLFEKIVELYPEKIAIEYDGASASYQKLDDQSNRIASFLVKNGINKNSKLGLYLRRSISSIAAIVAALKLEVPFLLIDVSLPNKRIDYFLADCDLDFFLYDNSVNEKIISHKNSYHISLTDNVTDNLFFDSIEPKWSNSTMYFVYTSGSTGVPKGVLVPSEGVVNTLLNKIEKIQLLPNDRFLINASFSFDGFFWELLGCLFVGGTGFLTTESQRRSVKSITNIILDKKITIATLTPSLARIFKKDILRKLRVLICAGERLDRDLFIESSSSFTMFNAYGTAETSICATIGKCEKKETINFIGESIKNTFVYVLDKDGVPTEPGEIGTLYIGGIGISKGYINSPELTKTKFVTLNVQGKTHLMYDTGDLVKLHPLGKLEYIGRKDDEVKICGKRTNLEEIRIAILSHPKIKQCTVTTKKLKKRGRIKIFAVVLSSDKYLTEKDLKNHISISLPAYMVPAKIVIKDKMELSNNDKVVRRTEVMY